MEELLDKVFGNPKWNVCFNDLDANQVLKLKKFLRRKSIPSKRVTQLKAGSVLLWKAINYGMYDKTNWFGTRKDVTEEFFKELEEKLPTIFVEGKHVKEYVVSILWQHKNDLTVIRLTASLVKNASSEHEALGIAISENAETAGKYAMNMYLVTEVE
jgi:hypothetical protein